MKRTLTCCVMLLAKSRVFPLYYPSHLNPTENILIDRSSCQKMKIKTRWVSIKSGRAVIWAGYIGRWWWCLKIAVWARQRPWSLLLYQCERAYGRIMWNQCWRVARAVLIVWSVWELMRLMGNDGLRHSQSVMTAIIWSLLHLRVGNASLLNYTVDQL